MARIFDTPITTNDQSLDRVLAVPLPLAIVYLDGPTPAALEESMNRLARQNAGDLLIVRIQAGENPAAVRRFNISSSPAVVTRKDGEERSRAESITAADLEKHVAYLLGKGAKPQPAAAGSTTGRQAGQPGAAANGRSTGQSGAGSYKQPVTVSDTSFDQEVMRASGPVLVDFWAPWCGPCRMTDPILEKLAREMSGRLKVAKVNVDQNPATSQRYGVQSIPTMMIVKDGQVVDRWMGAMPEPAIRSRLSRWLS